jgi:hypothetical protein
MSKIRSIPREPVNPKATVPARFTLEFGDDDDTPAGAWHFYTHYGDEEGAPPKGMLFICPCGCGALRAVAFEGSQPKKPMWSFNGDVEKPTLTPSILIYQHDESGARVGEHWHGWLTDGVFRSC